MRVQFFNNEYPENALDFTYVSEDGNVERYRLEPQREYDLPDHIVQHLMSLSYPKYETKEDPETGQVATKRVGEKRRFTLVPVDNMPASKKRGKRRTTVVEDEVETDLEFPSAE